MIAVPTPMRTVLAAAHVIKVTASDPYASALHTESKPSRSASWTSGMVSVGVAPQYPMENPSLICDTPSPAYRRSLRQRASTA
jgi:hypothetical protein